ncbi:MAG: hypothetical protein QM682_17770 [Paracoccus sp. (in: a-proteobacteria)]|uniref:hypothetical protein n=1 Tax=Paracoccus sp. TaxID=267 RepID=UPI0039E2D73D
MEISPINPATPPSVKASQVSDGLEKAFLAEMLKYSGPKPDQSEFGGGIGEEQFSSMLNDTYAQALSRRLDLHLTGRIGAAK